MVIYGLVKPMTLSPEVGLKKNATISLFQRHLQALGYVLTVILPVILRTGKRPVIFEKYNGIGDVVCTIPAALELKKRHPGVEFIYNSHPEYVLLPRMGGVTGHVTTIRPIGIVGHWYRFLLSGFYHFASDDDQLDREAADVYIKDFGRPFGLELSGEHPRLHCEPSVMERMKSLLVEKGISGPFVVINTGPSWPVREWPHESWVALVHELKKEGDVQIVQLGTDSHFDIGKVELKPIPGVVSLVNQLTLEESAAIIELADVFVGIDSGLLHIAVSVGTSSVGLWGATSPQFRFSVANRRLFVVSPVECQGCHHRVPRLHWITGCPFDIKCMKEIGVEEVLQKCREGLKTP
jgi:ADP-heptose:LPS heptosyltransferase